ncbi:hypothetical protein AAY473_001115, partial [Plecturocebus cupreus]
MSSLQKILKYQPALSEAKVGRSQGQEIETILANMLLGWLRQENRFSLRGGGCRGGYGGGAPPRKPKEQEKEQTKSKATQCKDDEDEGVYDNPPPLKISTNQTQKAFATIDEDAKSKSLQQKTLGP